MSTTSLAKLGGDRSRTVGLTNIKKGIFYPMYNRPTKNSNPSVCDAINRHREETSFGGRNCFSVRKGGNRRGARPPFFRFLLKYFCGAEEKCKVETDPKFKAPERVSRGSTFQNGVSQFHKTSFGTGRVGNILRPNRCLPTYTYSPKIKKSSKVCVRDEDLSVPSTSFRSLFLPVGIHKSNVCSSEIYSQQRNTFPCVYRRFANTGENKRADKRVYNVCAKGVSLSGLESKYGEIRSDSFSGFRISGSPVRSDQITNVPNRKKMGSITEKIGKFLKTKADQCMVLGESDRSVNINPRSGRIGEITCTSTTVPFEPSLEGQTERGGNDYHPEENKELISLVDEQTQTNVRCITACTQTSLSPVHRCINDRLGGTLRGRDGLGQVDTCPESVRHQLEGNDGHFPSNEEMAAFLPQFNHPGFHRQYCGNVLHKQAGRNKGSSFGNFSRRDSTVLPESLNTITSESCGRQIECPSGQTIEAASNKFNRVVSESDNLQDIVPNVGNSQCRFICDRQKQTTSRVCFTNTGQPGLGSRCNVHQLEWPCSLCLPTMGHAEQCDRQNEVSLLRNDSNSSTVAQQGMVSRSIKYVDRSTSPVATDCEPVNTGVKQTRTLHVEDAQSSRLEVIHRHLQNRGFSNAVARRVSGNIRQSSSNVYNCRWRLFKDWCVEQQINPFCPSVPQVANYFVFLFEEKGLKPSTIEAYRSAINSVLKIIHVDIGKDEFLSRLIDNFYLDRHSQRRLTPKWSLPLVLRLLGRRPFEPIVKADLRALTLKTAFLVLMSTAARVSEIHALDFSTMRHDEEWSKVWVKPNPAFLAKTQTPKNPGVFTQFEIKALAPTLGPGLDADKLLCPVRALRAYMCRTKRLRKGKSKLFISYIPGHTKDVGVSTFSSWIKQLIKQTYQDANDNDFHLCHAHETRALASSFEFFKHASLRDLLEAGVWKHDTTFTQFYLRDISSIMGELHALGPIPGFARRC